MIVVHAPSQGGNTKHDDALQPPRLHNEGALQLKNEPLDAELEFVVVNDDEASPADRCAWSCLLAASLSLRCGPSCAGDGLRRWRSHHQH